MSLVAAYESDDDVEEEERAGTKSQRYLATLAILPPEIRAALEGQEADDDEDDDLWSPPMMGASSGSAAPRSDHALLAMLPAARGQMRRRAPPAPTPAVEDESEEEEEEQPTAAIPARPEPAVPEQAVPERRKRRALEHALMDGDMSAIDEAGVAVADVAPRVDSRTLEELADASHTAPGVAASFYNPKTGTDTTMPRPSKLQRRRHQINSLAVTAAERERDILQRKSSAMQIKHQTQSRYGW